MKKEMDILKVIIVIALITGILSGCTGKSSTTSSNEGKTSITSSNEITTPETPPPPPIPWDEGFDSKWVGSYKSRSTADYAVVFDLNSDGTYKLVYGENANIATTYSGKYNRNFNGGNSQSRLNYRITGLQVTNSDDNSITLRCSWRLPSGNDTENYTLYRQ